MEDRSEADEITSSSIKKWLAYHRRLVAVIDANDDDEKLEVLKTVGSMILN